MGNFTRFLGVALTLALAGSGLQLAEAQSQPEPVRISHFSGKEVPRFEALRYSAVHGRAGPSRDHPILWRYEREGLPVLIIKETRDWRRVRDPDGDEVWVQARMLSSNINVLVSQPHSLFRKPDATSAEIAKVERGVVARLSRCAEGWCAVEVDGEDGWMPERVLWGVEKRTAGL